MNNRLVIVGIVLLSALTLAGGVVLRLHGIDASDLITLGGTGLGALAGFLARENRNVGPQLIEE